MKIFDNKTNNEIISLSYRTTGTDRVLDCVLQFGTIKDITFGSTARGTIKDLNLNKPIVFENCFFNYVTFMRVQNCVFINCSFKNCEIHNSANITLKGCTSQLTTINGMSGKWVVENCSSFIFGGYGWNSGSDIVVKTDGSCHSLNSVLEMHQKQLAEQEEARRKSEELRKSIKYGYKVVQAPVLIKLSFPEDAELINLDKSKSRASKAYVEAIKVLNDFNGEGVTNKAYHPYCDYQVGKMVYPDSFNASPSESCGHGIHFCKNLEDIPNYAPVPVSIDQLPTNF